MPYKNVMLGDNQLPVKKFELEEFVPNPSICMIASRGSGKSWICRSILKHFSYFPGGVIISPTDRMSSFYGKFFPEVYIHYKYSSKLIQNILLRQKIVIEKLKTRYKKGEKVDPRAFLVMDDCLSSKKSWVRDQPILELLFNGRHYQIMYILTMQYPLGITPELRANFDYIFLLSADYVSIQKKLYTYYAGMFPTFDIFREVFTELTKNYGSMVIANRGANYGDYMNKIFWFKADEENVGQMGCDQFNKFHKDNYNKKWKARDMKYDLSRFVNKSRQSF